MKKLFIIGILMIFVGTSFFSGCVETGAIGTLHLKITDKPGDFEIIHGFLKFMNRKYRYGLKSFAFENAVFSIKKIDLSPINELIDRNDEITEEELSELKKYLKTFEMFADNLVSVYHNTHFSLEDYDESNTQDS